MSVVISITRRESRPHFSERNNVRALRKSMKAILKASTIACGLIAVGCASKMGSSGISVGHFRPPEL